MRRVPILVSLLISLAVVPIRAQTAEEIGATIGSYLRASYILEQATSECAKFGLQAHDFNSDLRDVMLTRWGGAFTNDVLVGIRKEATKSIQNVRVITDGNSKDFYCGFLVGSASQGHLLRRAEWSRLKAASGSKR